MLVFFVIAVDSLLWFHSSHHIECGVLFDSTKNRKMLGSVIFHGTNSDFRSIHKSGLKSNQDAPELLSTSFSNHSHSRFCLSSFCDKISHEKLDCYNSYLIRIKKHKNTKKRKHESSKMQPESFLPPLPEGLKISSILNEAVKMLVSGANTPDRRSQRNWRNDSPQLLYLMSSGIVTDIDSTTLCSTNDIGSLAISNESSLTSNQSDPERTISDTFSLPIREKSSSSRSSIDSSSFEQEQENWPYKSVVDLCKNQSINSSRSFLNITLGSIQLGQVYPPTPELNSIPSEDNKGAKVEAIPVPISKNPDEKDVYATTPLDKIPSQVYSEQSLPITPDLLPTSNESSRGSDSSDEQLLLEMYDAQCQIESDDDVPEYEYSVYTMLRASIEAPDIIHFLAQSIFDNKKVVYQKFLLKKINYNDKIKDKLKSENIKLLQYKSFFRRDEKDMPENLKKDGMWAIENWNKIGLTQCVLDYWFFEKALPLIRASKLSEFDVPGDDGCQERAMFFVRSAREYENEFANEPKKIPECVRNIYALCYGYRKYGTEVVSSCFGIDKIQQAKSIKHLTELQKILTVGGAKKNLQAKDCGGFFKVFRLMISLACKSEIYGNLRELKFPPPRKVGHISIPILPHEPAMSQMFEMIEENKWPLTILWHHFHSKQMLDEKTAILSASYKIVRVKMKEVESKCSDHLPHPCVAMCTVNFEKEEQEAIENRLDNIDDFKESLMNWTKYTDCDKDMKHTYRNNNGTNFLEGKFAKETVEKYVETGEKVMAPTHVESYVIKELEEILSSKREKNGTQEFKITNNQQI